jgi:hypothetical protein
MLKKLITFLSVLLVLSSSVVLAQNPFESVVNSLKKIGFFDVLIFILFAIIFFSILVKSKILGENMTLNAVAAGIVAFMLFVYPVFSGFSLVEPLSVFFTQIGALLILLIFAFIVSSIFYPDMPKMIGEQFTKPNVMYIMIFLVIILIIISGVVRVLWTGITSISPGISNIVILVAGILVFIMILYVAVSVGGGGK